MVCATTLLSTNTSYPFSCFYLQQFTKQTHAYVFWGDFLITNRKMQQFFKGAVKQSNILESPTTAKCPFELNMWGGKIT